MTLPNEIDRPLDVAIIGGGASGLATAWMLDPVHRVVLYERAGVLGGHIRTLGRNVTCPALPANVFLDTGVVELDRENFPLVHRYLCALGVSVSDLVDGGSTSLFLPDGTHYCSPALADAESRAQSERMQARARLLPLALRRRRFLRRTARLAPADLEHASIEAFLSDDDFSLWVRSLLMYAYSMPYESVREISAAMAIPMLRDFLKPNHWTRVEGGMAAYVERVAASLEAAIVLGARVRVRRTPDAVEIVEEDGSARRFDAVVLAVPPHRLLEVLLDPTPEESARFGSFEGGTIETIVHTDAMLRARTGVVHRTEFDLFALPDGSHGYDAYLNRLAGLPTDHPPHYGLAFGLERALDASKILHRQRHDVAHYTERALEHRTDIERSQGERRTFVVGAFLGDGLHEGAIRSALAVSRALGGRSLAP